MELKRKQRGASLVDVMLGLGVMSVGLVGMTELYSMYQADVRTQATVEYQRAFAEAGTKYLKDNFATISATATATAPVSITLATLQAGGYLSTGVMPANPYSQTTCIRVLKPSANVLEGFVLTSGGKVLDDVTLAAIAASSGGSGGFIKSDAPTVATGAYGGWSKSLANFTDCAGAAPTPGHLATSLFFNNLNTQADYIYRGAVPNHPEANTLTTPITLAPAAEGAACTQANATAQANGATLNCVSDDAGVTFRWRKASHCTKLADAADLNAVQTDGCYEVTSPANAPDTTPGLSWFVDVKRSGSVSGFKSVQNATGFGVGAHSGKQWSRTQDSAVTAAGWGVWKKTSGAGSGTSAILEPLIGKQIQCDLWQPGLPPPWPSSPPVKLAEYFAKVDSNGRLFTRVNVLSSPSVDSSWSPGGRTTVQQYFPALNGAIQYTASIGDSGVLALNGTTDGCWSFQALVPCNTTGLVCAAEWPAD